MKRTIVLLLLFSFVLPCSTNAVTFDDNSGDVVQIHSIDTIFPILSSTELFLVTQNDDIIDFSKSRITWFIDGRDKATGINLQKFLLEIDESPTPINVRARVQYNFEENAGEGVYYDAIRVITPTRMTSRMYPNTKLTPKSTTEGEHNLSIETRPPSPRPYELTTFRVIDKQGRNLGRMPIKWSINGEESHSEFPGDIEFSARIPSLNASTTVKVEISDIGESEEITLAVKRNSKLDFQTSQATRVGLCVAQQLRMMQSNIDQLEREKNAIIKEYNKLIRNVNEDYVFLKDSVSNIITDFIATTAHVETLATETSTEAAGKPWLIATSLKIASISNYIISNPISRRLKYVYNQIDYYVKLINWLETTQERLRIRTQNMVRQTEDGAKRCRDIANEKPDFSHKIGELNDWDLKPWASEW